MADTKTAVRDAVVGTAPFLAITVIWLLVMTVLYALFLVTKPADITYDAWVHALVFVPPLVGFAGHTLRLALRPADA